MEKKRSDCPVSCSLDIFGDKWSLLIIRDVMMNGKLSYGEFLQSEEKIATNILAKRLQTLEAEKILLKEVSPQNKSKFEYTLTQKGVELLPILIEIMDWGNKYNENCSQKELTEKITINKTKVIKDLTQKLMERVK